MNTTSRLLVLAFAMFTALAVTAGAVEARTRQSTVTTGGGATASRSVVAADGQVTDTTTGPQGNSRVRDVARSASGTSATVTGANGAVSSRTSVPTGTGSTTTVTGRNGRVGTVSVQH